MTTTNTARRPHVCRLTVQTKKNAAPQPVAFVVALSIDHPTLDGRPTYPSWRTGGTFAAYNQPQRAPSDWVAYQLRSDIDPDTLPANYNRSHFAGVKPYENGRTGETPNPGQIIFRGKGLGELAIRTGTYTDVSVRGQGMTDRPTDGERAFVLASIVPTLADYVAKNRRSLYLAAVDQITEAAAQQLREARERLDKCEAEAARAIADLLKNTPPEAF